ncbi:MAG TPA: UbiH/UbiF/VisC/COQ6 family ubiquinone biosynthesis hydroxylase [Gammaproteobacteria bacterium]|nr:UbiH/UbiF/VisC/COQ6 family ubiquinone biosynthesis hydroxylase [Gammaproteobacteria bacterium]
MKVDAVIVGGGLVGLATARLLSQNGFQVCVLDVHPCTPSPLSESYEPRVSAITLSSVKLFQELGVWEKMQQMRVGEFTQIKIWEGDNTASVSFDSAHGYIIENKVMQLALLDSNIEIIAPVVINNITKSKDNLSLSLSNNQIIETKTIIGADGANSKIREWAELGLVEKSYDQSALVATIHTTLPHDHIARQRFLSEGPLAFLPLSQENHCSIVWTNKPETTQHLLKLSSSEFNSELEKYWGKELGELKVVGERFAFNLTKKHAEHYVKERVVLVGDAAHTIHPLAGQGVNLGFLDAKVLCTTFIQARSENRDIGLMHTLRRYERARKGDNLIVQKLMDVFNSATIRKCGMKLVSNFDFLKNSMQLWMTQREK